MSITYKDDPEGVQAVADAINERVGSIAKKLTHQMIRMMKDVDVHGDPHFSQKSSRHAGAQGQVFFALIRRNLITSTDDLKFVLTPLGRLVMARLLAK